MITQDRKCVFGGMCHVFTGLIRKDPIDSFVPDPFNLMSLVRNLRYIMNRMTGPATGVATSLITAFAYVYHHSPTAFSTRRGIGLVLSADSPAHKRAGSGHDGRTGQEPQKILAGNVHRSPPLLDSAKATGRARGAAWHFQQSGDGTPAKL
jgi:hypothetical protein